MIPDVFLLIFFLFVVVVVVMGGHLFHTSIRSEQGLEDLHWLFCSSVWLMNEDKLGFSTDRDAGFICFSKSRPDAEVCALKTQNLSSVFSVQTLKASVRPVGASPEDFSR